MVSTQVDFFVNYFFFCETRFYILKFLTDLSILVWLLLSISLQFDSHLLATW